MSDLVMTPEHLAGTLAVAKQRERKRCLGIVTQLTNDYPVGSPERRALDRVAYAVMGGPAAIVAGDGIETEKRAIGTSQHVDLVFSDGLANAPKAAGEDGPQDGLPPVRHGDDFDDGVALARSLGSLRR